MSIFTNQQLHIQSRKCTETCGFKKKAEKVSSDMTDQPKQLHFKNLKLDQVPTYKSKQKIEAVSCIQVKRQQQFHKCLLRHVIMQMQRESQYSLEFQKFEKLTVDHNWKGTIINCQNNNINRLTKNL